jgi:hypothetical protein
MVTVVSLAKRSERPSLVIVNRRLPGNGEGQLPTELTELWSELLPTIISSAFSLRSTTSGAVSSSANGPVASADASAPCYVSFEPPGAMGRFHYYASQPPLTAYDTPGPVAAVIGIDGHPRDAAKTFAALWKATESAEGADAAVRTLVVAPVFQVPAGDAPGCRSADTPEPREGDLLWTCASWIEGGPALFACSAGSPMPPMIALCSLPERDAGSWLCPAVRCSVQESDGLARVGRLQPACGDGESNAPLMPCSASTGASAACHRGFPGHRFPSPAARPHATLIARASPATPRARSMPRALLFSKINVRNSESVMLANSPELPRSTFST